MEQTLWPPPSIPIWRKANDWHRENVRRQRDNTPTQPQISKWQWQGWSGGRIEKFKLFIRKMADGERKTLIQVLRTEDPCTHAYVLGTRPASGDRKRNVERVCHNLSGRCRLTLYHTHVFQRTHALRTHSGTNSVFISGAHSFTQVCQTEGDRTQMFDRATGKSSVRFPHCLTAHTHLHLAHLRFAHT